MRYLSAVCLLPLLFVAQSAEAARISLATKDCGTPPLLGLTFDVLTLDTVSGLNTVSGATTACPLEAVGSLVDPTGTQPLYGNLITSVEFTVGNLPGTTPIILDDGSALIAALTFNNGILTAVFDVPIIVQCGGINVDSRLCFPPDLAIGLFDFPVGTTFEVTGVNVPEPATLALLGIGLAAAGLRRRRVTATSSCR